MNAKWMHLKVATVMNESDPKGRTGLRIANLGMMACCVIMVAPIAAVLLAGGGIASITVNLGALLPLALCLGLNFVMHRMMGRSCHGASDTSDDAQPIEVDDPVEVATPSPRRHIGATKPLS